MVATVENTPEEIRQLVDSINEALKHSAESMIAGAPGRDHPFIKFTYDRIYNYLSDGGKRAHAQAVLLSYQAVGGCDVEAALLVAVGFQLYHHYAMVHDDVYDDDKNRRNRPTDHEVFRQWFMKQGITHDHQHFGKADKNPLFVGNAERKAAVAGLVYGKIIHAFSFEAILAAPFNKQLLYSVIKLLNWHDVYDNIGQMKDLLSEAVVISDPQECLQIAYLKTGKEYQACTTAGAMLAGASQSQINALNEWASCFGMAYQLQDDLEDIEPDSEKGLGRGVGSDIIARKSTFMAVTALQQARGSAKRLLNDWLNYVGDAEVDIEAVAAAIRGTGAIEICRDKVTELLERGEQALREAEPHLDERVIRRMNLMTNYFLSGNYWKRPMPVGAAGGQPVRT
jgi:geranylgeranyl diphosphate synthase, type I